MPTAFFGRPGPGARKRLWVYQAVFILLLAHVLALNFIPGYFDAFHSEWAAAFISPVGNTPQAVLERDDGLYLWGGADESQHFDINEFRLDATKLPRGVGRETFPALIEPAFEPLDQADRWLANGDRVLALELGGEVRVYPIDLLVRHEVVNDVVNGVPVFAAFCVLADLGAVYDRRIAGHTLTFAVSGYTYSDPDVWDGMNMFILWDRETQSLWWPGTGRAVSGLMIDQPLPLLDRAHWSQTTWGRVKDRYHRARVLQRGQDMDPPDRWPRLTRQDLQQAPAERQRAADQAQPVPIAPRWGQNADGDR